MRFRLWGNGLGGGFLAVEVSTGSEHLSRAGINAVNPLCAGGHKLQREQKEDRSGQEGPWATMLQMFYPSVSCFMLGIELQSLEEVSEQSPIPAHPTGPLQQHLKPQTETTELLHRSCPSSLWLSNCKIPPIAGDNSTPSLWHTRFCTHLNFAPFLLCTGLLHTCLFFRHHS